MKIKRIILLLFIFVFTMSVFCIPTQAKDSFKILNKNEKLFQRVVDGWKNHEKTIYVKDLNISVNYLKDVYYFITTNNPEYFYVGKLYTYSYEKNKVVEIFPEYDIKDKKVINKKQKEINKASNKILNQVPKNASDYDKCLLIHDLLTQYITYDEFANGNNKYNIYGALVNKKAVCQGYSVAYKYLLNKVGVKCNTVASIPMNHMWNKVKLNKKYYHVDVTRDDLILNKEKKLQKTTHDFFLLNDKEMTSKEYHSWVSCGDKKSINSYSGKKVHKKAMGKVYKKGNNYYYINNNCNLVKESNKEKVVEIYKNNKNKEITLGENKYTVPNLTDCIYHNGLIYFNDCDTIYSYDIKKNKVRVIKKLKDKYKKKSSYYAEFSIKSNEKLYGSILEYATGKYIQFKI